MMDFIDAKRVRELLPMTECIQVMRDLFSLNPETEVLNPLRTKMFLPNRGVLGMMPAALIPYKVSGIKIITVYPENYKKGLSSHQGIVHLFDSETGTLLVSLDGDEVTAIRTAAVSALATDLLAPEKASDLCLLGSGTQAASHLESMTAVRPIRNVTVWSNSRANAEKFIAAHADKYEVSFRCCDTVAEAVQTADIICAVTAATTPILKNEWLQGPVHINAVGVSLPGARELDTAIIYTSDVYIDNYVAAVQEAGDLILAAADRGESAVEKRIKADLHALVTGKIKPGNAPKTVFKSVGIGAEDVAVARYCYQKIS